MKLYRALLLLYPKSFRGDYGPEMDAIFGRRRKNARGSSRAGLWLEAIVDVFSNAPAVHWEILKQDVGDAVRSIVRLPMFSATVMLVAALGIGATTAAFTVADHVLVRPLPFPGSDRLVKVWQTANARGYGRFEISPGNFRDWKAQATSFEQLAAYNASYSANLIDGGDPLRLNGALVTGDLFGVLQSQAAIGRTIGPDDDQETAPRTVVLSDALWRNRFNADANVLGRTIILDDAPRTVIGVMPPSFQFPTRTITFWAPFQFAPGDYADRTNVYLYGIARLKDGVRIEHARSEMTTIAENLARAYPDSNRLVGATVIALRDELSQQSRLLLWGVVAASVGVLLIACVNLANLLLARALSRKRELAVRAALGAGRDRLVRQLFTESMLLSALGGGAGIALALAVVPLIARLVPTTLPIADTPGVDGRMLAVAALATLATAIGFGVIPAMRAGRHADATALGEGPRAGSSRRTERLRAALVIVEVTASVVLLVCSGLLARALWKVQQTDPGFKTDGVLTLRTTLPLPKYDPTNRKLQFYNQVLSDVRALPGVSNAAYISFLPMIWKGGVWGVTIDGQPNEASATSTVLLRIATPGFFDTLGIPLELGRDFSDSDTVNSSLSAVVSESFVRKHWDGRNPIGRQFSLAGRQWTVVGVAGDIKLRGLERETEPQVYLSPAQIPDGNMPYYNPKDLAVKTSLPAGTLVPAIRQIIKRADPQQPISDVQPLSDVLTNETAPRRVQVRVLGAFAAIAFLLAGIGLHGLLAFNVSAQARDIGVRMALGAEKRSIIMMVLRYGLTLAGIGVILGGGLAYAAGRTLQALLAGVSPTDTATFAAAVTLSLLMTLAGSLLPALRAVRVDPITVIRSE
jgi:predicted permease